MKVNLVNENKAVKKEYVDFVLKCINPDYQANMNYFIENGIESATGEMITQEVKYKDGEMGEEVKELKFSIKFKDKSFFQPHNDTEMQFTLDALKSILEGEINTFVTMVSENV